MPLTNGSGSFYFRHCPSRCQQKTNLKKSFPVYCILLYLYIIFKDKKSEKDVTNSRNQGFSYYICLMIEGSGSGSGRPKNTWIRIRIRIRIRRLVSGPGCEPRMKIRIRIHRVKKIKMKNFMLCAHSESFSYS
jgi:hypothetical protein